MSMSRVAKILRHCACVGALLLLGACAFGDRMVTLSYQTETAKAAAATTATAAATPASTASKGTYVLIPLKDERPQKQMVGEVRNGWGMHTADVVADNDVAEWVTDGIRQELAKAGYTVVGSAADDPAAPQIEGTVTRVFCTALFSYEADVSFFVVLRRDGKELVNRQYHGTGSAGVNMAATSGSYKESLNKALADALSDLLADIRTAQTAGS